MRSTRLFEESIRQTLSNISNQAEASEWLSLRVKNAIRQQTNKEESVMKKRFTLKSVAIIAAVLCLTTVTVFAASRVSGYISMSSTKAAYTSFPAEETLQKDLGFVPKAVSTFSNGYTFTSAEIAGISAVDKSGKKISDTKAINYRYTSGQGKKISLSVHKVLPDESMDSKAVKTDYKGITLLYSSQKYKFVPENYKMTEEDKKAQQSGEVEYSYGSDKVENSLIQNVIWMNNGVSYNLMAMDSDLTQADLTAMAKETVDKSK
jgi:hypothetical protein